MNITESQKHRLALNIYKKLKSLGINVPAFVIDILMSVISQWAEEGKE